MSLYSSIILITILLIQLTTAKIVWKIKPQATQLAREHENIKLNCEFENIAPLSPSNYFVIWYKDGASQNVLSLNDQLANPNNSNYEITGKYSLIVKNVTRNDSGQYTCQLFQSNDLVATVNLTVLVAPKYAKINVKQTTSNYVINKGYFIENDLINLECCTNDDTNPEPRFVWSKLARNSYKQQQPVIINSNGLKAYVNTNGQLCNSLQLNLTRQDNNYFFKCSVTNDALINAKKEDTFFISIEYKPEVKLHLKSKPNVVSLSVIEDSSVTLYCNSTAIPTATNYDWYLNDQQITTPSRNTDSLQLFNLNREHAGNYSCKCTNRHGFTKAYFNIDVIYAQILPINKTSTLLRKLKLKDSIYLTSNENSSVTLQCELKSNPLIDNVIWYFYQLNKSLQVIHKVRLSNWISSIKTILNETEKRYYSQLNLNNLTSDNTGYYSCSIQTELSDDLSQTKQINLNSTYFLQVKYSPELTTSKMNIYASNYDQVSLKCQVKSNPTSFITWYFDNKEIFQNYKYNLSVNQLKQIDDESDLDNVNQFESILTINSLTPYDYGDYSCRATNQLGTILKTIKLNLKKKPEIPNDLKTIETTSNSVQLTWQSPQYTGENTTYVINVNQTFNLTSFTDSDTDPESSMMIAELKGLQTDTEYNFRVLAFNSLGSSQFSQLISVKTLKTTLKSELIPRIQIAKFSDIREAICFNLEHSDYAQQKLLRDLVIRIDLKRNDLNNETLKDTNSIKTLLINLNKLKLGQNCIPFKQLIEIDLLQQKNSTLSSVLLNKKIVYSLNTPLAQHETFRVQSTDILGRSFFEFKRFNSMNISVCYANDSNICTEQQLVIDNNYDFSNYITLVAIGCSAVLIFIILLISSLCCCCCRRRNKLANKDKKAKIANPKLGIKSFPIVLPNQPNQQQKNSFDFSDDCIKSSQHHILNGSSSSSSSSSSSKNYYNTKTNIMEQNLYDPNIQKYMTNSYKMEYPQNTSSIATVESDVSSSISLENNSNNITKSNKTSDAGTHSPFAIITDSNAKSVFASITSSSYSNMISNMSQKQSTKQVPQSSTLVYSGSGNMYIKTYQAQQSQSSQYFNNQKTILDNSESGYSTPSNNNISKKLVYEVIV